MNLEQALIKVNTILDKLGLDFEVDKDNFEVYEMQEVADLDKLGLEFEVDKDDFVVYEMQEVSGDCKEIELVYSKGDFEGAGSYAVKVFKFNPKDEDPFFIRVEGEFNSWSGTEWDSPQLVEPYEVVVTQYRVVK